MSNPKARIGVVGTGWWATYTHLPALLSHPDVEIAGIADPDLHKLRLAADHFHVSRAYADFRDLLAQERPDGVVVAAPHAAHYVIARAALENGCHVLIEKPMVLRPSEARDLVRLARHVGREIVMSYPWNYTAHVRRAREAVLAGELGDIELVTSMFTSTAYETYRGDLAAYAGVLEAPVVGPSVDSNTALDRGGGQGYVQVTHSAALAFWITGLRPQLVTAFMNQLDTAVDVVDTINIRLTNSAIGVVSSTGNLRPGDAGQHTLSVYASRGYFLLDLIAGTLIIRKHDGTLESPPPLEVDARYPRRAPANNLVSVVLGKQENLAPGEIGWITVNLLDAAHRSVVLGGSLVTVEDAQADGPN